MQAHRGEYPLYKPAPDQQELMVWHQVIEHLYYRKQVPFSPTMLHYSYDHLTQITHLTLQVYLPSNKIILKDDYPDWSKLTELLDYGIEENIPEALHYILLYT